MTESVPASETTAASAPQSAFAPESARASGPEISRQPAMADALGASGTPAERAATMVARARDLGPLLDDAARDAELERRLPERVADALKQAGLYWMKTPTELGGSELDPLGFSDVLEEIAYHDTSAAWSIMVGNGTTGTMAGWLPGDGVDELFGGDRLPIVAGQFTPRGAAIPVDGGYRVTGKWGFGSGIDHADWVVGGCLVEGTGEPIFATVPKGEATVLGNWNAAALQGTGSHDYTIDDVFVPNSRAMAAYGGAPQRGGSIFRQPIMIFISNELSPIVVGVAKRAIDDMIALAGTTTRSLAGGLPSRASFLKAIGRAEAQWQAARALYRGAALEGYDIVAHGGEIDDGRVAELRARHTLAAELCEELVRDLFRYGGGRVLSVEAPMQRHLRNLLGALQHIYLSEENYELAGAARLKR
ncbi:MAG: acyl-CoA dehydrogenase family protein [Pseudoclavibacter sp.]